MEGNGQRQEYAGPSDDDGNTLREGEPGAEWRKRKDRQENSDQTE